MLIAPQCNGEDAAWQMYRMFIDEMRQIHGESDNDRDSLVDTELKPLGYYAGEFIRDTARLLVREICLAYPGDVPYAPKQSLYLDIADDMRPGILAAIMAEWPILVRIHYEGKPAVPTTDQQKKLRRTIQQLIAEAVVRKSFHTKIEKILAAEILIRPTVNEAVGEQLNRMTIREVNQQTGGGMLRNLLTDVTIKKLEDADIICMRDLQGKTRKQVQEKTGLGKAAINSISRLLAQYNRFMVPTPYNKRSSGR